MIIIIYGSLSMEWLFIYRFLQMLRKLRISHITPSQPTCLPTFCLCVPLLSFTMLKFAFICSA